ncbi:MAG TPA: hypothetical protein PK500_06150 [Candidatus Egerieousia sp.]|nr:hypothetical protein [Candidatus Egerieousia sp.]
MKIFLRTFLTTCVIAIISLFFESAAGAQSKDSLLEKRFEAFSKLLSPEKLYLHTDKEFYCVGDTLWFKGYLVNNSYLSEFPECNFIYVELIGNSYEKNIYSGKTEEVQRTLERVKVKRRGGVLQGYMVIPGGMSTGKAFIRGYSYWNLNFPAEYIFSKSLNIVNPMKDDFLKKLIDNKVKERDEYTKIGAKYPFDNEKVKMQDIDFQLFPESGRLIAGMKTVIAFKAISEMGLGEKVSGIVYDSSGSRVISFEGNDLGFGKFEFELPLQDNGYYAVVTDNRGINKKVNFPTVETSGVLVNISYKGNNILSRVCVTQDINQDSLRYVLHNGSELFYDQPLEKVKNLVIATDKLSTGIIDAAVVDTKGNVYASRQFFIMSKNNFLLDITTDKNSYGPRETVKMKLTMKNAEAGDEQADVSVSVTDNILAPSSGSENNIVSYMLLGSEIRGYIENPQSYFDEDIPFAERMQNIDLLMLTQGWRYYDLPAILKGENKMPVFGKEYIQTISGRVRGVKKQKSSLVSFVAPSIHFSAMGQLDSTGYFELKDVSFPDSTLFIVNSVGVNGKKSFIPSINDDAFAPIVKYYSSPDSLINYSQKVGQDLMQKYYNTGGTLVYQLDPLYVIAGRKMKPINDPSPIPNQMFKKGQLREGKDLEPFKNYDLMTYIYETCQGLRLNIDSTTGEKVLVCRVPHVATGMTISDGWEEIKVFINGVNAFSSSELQNFMVNDISSLVYLTGADAAPYSPMMDGSATVRSVIMIRTVLNVRTGVPRNVTKGYPMGWQRPKYFYSPSYDLPAASKVPLGSDKRSTIYWNPNVEIGENGSASLQFDTSDGNSDYNIKVEGVTKRGDFILKKATLKRKIKYY